MAPSRPRIVLLALFVAGSARAATWTVAPDGTGDFPTIQAAVDAAVSGDEILLEDGTFTGAGNRDIEIQGKRLTLRSISGDPQACVLDCENAAPGIRIRYISDLGNPPTISGLTIQNADGISLDGWNSSPFIDDVVVRNGGIPAIRVYYGTTVITGCVLESNTIAASSSGALLLASATALIDNCTLEGNGSTTGHIAAAITIQGGATTLRDCEIRGNLDGGLFVTDYSGHGAPLPFPDALIENCSVEDNAFGVSLRGKWTSTYGMRDTDVTGNTGDGLTFWGKADLTVDRCSFRENHVGIYVGTGAETAPVIRDCEVEANRHHGMFVGGTEPLIERCVVRGNGTGGALGTGGIRLSYCRPVLRQCLVTGNAVFGVGPWHCATTRIEECTIASNGGAIDSGGGITAVVAPSVDVVRSIVWGNCSDDGTEIWADASSDVTLDCVNVDPALVSVGGALSLVDVLDADPLFCQPLDCAAGPSTGGLYALPADSPALLQPCGPMGATQPLCEAVGAGAALRAASWGAIKRAYR